MHADQIKATDAAARARFTYRGDGLFDQWRSHADDVLAGRAWAGDCDDMASTVLDLLGREGLALDRRFRMWVASRGTMIDHMVACAVDDQGRFWIVGDTFAPAYPAGDMRHSPMQSWRLDERRADGTPNLREGAPFTRADR
jgi:hypothetical protein